MTSLVPGHLRRELKWAAERELAAAEYWSLPYLRALAWLWALRVHEDRVGGHRYAAARADGNVHSLCAQIARRT